MKISFLLKWSRFRVDIRSIFGSGVLVVMCSESMHSLSLQALAERLDHFDRVADVALGDLCTMSAMVNPNYTGACYFLNGLVMSYLLL